MITEDMVKKADKIFWGDHLSWEAAMRAALECILPDVVGEASEICRLLLEAEDILNDLPDDSDVALANGIILEAIKRARTFYPPKETPNENG